MMTDFGAFSLETCFLEYQSDITEVPASNKPIVHYLNVMMRQHLHSQSCSESY